MKCRMCPATARMGCLGTIWEGRWTLYCSAACGARYTRQRRIHVTQAYRAKRRHAVEGRSCKHCGLNDSEAAWSGETQTCRTCARQKSRRGSCACGHILRCCGSRLRPMCYVCDEHELRECGRMPVILLAPNDDRERTVWRSNTASAINTRGFELSDVMTATKEQWKSWR